jgi:hypothetical protein
MRGEKPVLAFSSCHITIHLLVENDVAEAIGRPPGRHARRAESPPLSCGEKEGTDVAIDSYERDMLAYAYRNRRPFRTYGIGQPDGITAFFPSILNFVSEDTEVHLLASGAADDQGRQVDLDVSVCLTWFEESGLGVLHVTFSPAAGYELNEYDIVKFVKLWEGGEFITRPISFYAGGEELGKPWPLEIDGPNDPKIASWTYHLLTALVRWASRDRKTRLKLVSSAQPGASSRKTGRRGLSWPLSRSGSFPCWSTPSSTSGNGITKGRTDGQGSGRFSWRRSAPAARAGGRRPRCGTGARLRRPRRGCGRGRSARPPGR